MAALVEMIIVSCKIPCITIIWTPVCLSQGVVVDGEGVMTVDAVGKSTIHGQLALELGAKDEREAPLQVKLGKLGQSSKCFHANCVAGCVTNCSYQLYTYPDIQLMAFRGLDTSEQPRSQCLSCSNKL